MKGIHLVIKAKGRIMKKEKLVFNLKRDDLADPYKSESKYRIESHMFKHSSLGYIQTLKADEINFTDEDGSKICLKKRINGV